MNAGQTCVRPDYIVVHQDVAEQFIDNIKSFIVQMFGTEAKSSEFFGRIINQRAHQRLVKLLKENKQYIVYGGGVDEEAKVQMAKEQRLAS